MMPPELKRVVAEVLQVEGIYLLQDTRAPTQYVVFVSKGGKLVAMSPDQELRADGFSPYAKVTSLVVFVPEDPDEHPQSHPDDPR